MNWNCLFIILHFLNQRGNLLQWKGYWLIQFCLLKEKGVTKITSAKINGISCRPKSTKSKTCNPPSLPKPSSIRYLVNSIIYWQRSVHNKFSFIMRFIQTYHKFSLHKFLRRLDCRLEGSVCWCRRRWFQFYLGIQSWMAQGLVNCSLYYLCNILPGSQMYCKNTASSSAT